MRSLQTMYSPFFIPTITSNILLYHSILWLKFFPSAFIAVLHLSPLCFSSITRIHFPGLNVSLLAYKRGWEFCNSLHLECTVQHYSWCVLHLFSLNRICIFPKGYFYRQCWMISDWFCIQWISWITILEIQFKCSCWMCIPKWDEHSVVQMTLILFFL